MHGIAQAFTAQITPDTFGEWDYTTGMDHVSAPLLVIHGELDTLGFESQNAWSSSFSDGTIMKVPNAGRTAITDQPEYFVSM